MPQHLDQGYTISIHCCQVASSLGVSESKGLEKLLDGPFGSQKEQVWRVHVCRFYQFLQLLLSERFRTDLKKGEHWDEIEVEIKGEDEVLVKALI